MHVNIKLLLEEVVEMVVKRVVWSGCLGRLCGMSR